MRKILIAGCGYVGHAVAELFHEAGDAVEGWTKSPPGIAKPYPIQSVDISDPSAVRKRAGNFDIVVHCASTRGGDVDLYRKLYVEGTRNLVDAFPGAKVLFTSSTSVYAQKDGEWVTEESATEPSRETSQALLQAEEIILNAKGIVLRLAGIYGPGRSALLDKFVNGTASVPKDYFVNQVHRDDIAAAISLLSNHPNCAGQIFNVTDGNPKLVSRCYEWLARTLGRPLPDPNASSPPQVRKRGESNKRVSNARLKEAGWGPRYPTFEEGMEKSVLPSRDLPAS